MHLSMHRGRWTLRYRDQDGKRKRKPLPESLPADLSAPERAALLRRCEASLGAPRRAGTLAQFLEQHEAALAAGRARPASMLSTVRTFAGILEGAMGDITAVDAEDALLALPRAASTRVTYRWHLSAVWEEARRRGWCQGNPWREMRAPRGPGRPVPALVDDEMARLFSACGAHRAPLEFLYETGMRVSEALALVVEDIAGGAATLRRTKTGRPRVVPLTPRAAELVAGTDQERGIGRARRIFAAGPDALRRALHAACASAGLPRLRLHDLRHLCGVRLIRAGANLHDVKELLGHTNVRQTERYVGHAPDAGARRAIAALAHDRSASSTAAKSIRGPQIS